jgi:hypothetical protein
LASWITWKKISRNLNHLLSIRRSVVNRFVRNLELVLAVPRIRARMLECQEFLVEAGKIVPSARSSIGGEMFLASDLKLPLTCPAEGFKLFTKDGTPFSNAYTRVVIGGRGPYIEFLGVHIPLSEISVPHNQAWRLRPEYSYVFYNEWRHNKAGFMIYEQRRKVSYADYAPERWYVSPWDLYVEVRPSVFEPAVAGERHPQALL